ncbi:MAG: hypothetical protein IPO24_06630 [Bacteroidetes bacterium]|nr:hypothetical protein [Bacteroidota bacterium]
MVQFKTKPIAVNTTKGVQVAEQPKRRKLKSKGENTTPLVPVAENETCKNLPLRNFKRNENYLVGLVPVKG